MAMDFPGEFLVRRAELRDRGRIVELMSERHPGSFPARFAWLYRSNPQGAASTWLAFERSNGRLAGCTSIFPRRLMVQGVVHRGAVGGDCYVRPAFRRRGIATLLHRATAAGLPNLGIEMMFGPPNAKNYDALRKAGSNGVGNFGSWTRPLVPEASRLPRPLDSLGLKVLDALTGDPGRHFRLEPVSVDETGCAMFLEKASSEYAVIGVRDLSFVRWRYVDSVARTQRPFIVKREGKVVGFVVLETERTALHVVDFLTLSDPAVIDASLALVVAHGRRLCCSTISIDAKSESQLGRRLTRRGFLPRRSRGFQVLGAPGAVLPPAVLVPGSWHFLNGDEDLDTLARVRPLQEPASRVTVAS